MSIKKFGELKNLEIDYVEFCILVEIGLNKQDPYVKGDGSNDYVIDASEEIEYGYEFMRYVTQKAKLSTEAKKRYLQELEGAARKAVPATKKNAA